MCNHVIVFDSGSADLITEWIVLSLPLCLEFRPFQEAAIILPFGQSPPFPAFVSHRWPSSSPKVERITHGGWWWRPPQCPEEGSVVVQVSGMATLQGAEGNVKLQVGETCLACQPKHNIISCYSLLVQLLDSVLPDAINAALPLFNLANAAGIPLFIYMKRRTRLVSHIRTRLTTCFCAFSLEEKKGEQQ